MYADRRNKTEGLKTETSGLVEPKFLSIQIGGLSRYSANERPGEIDTTTSHKSGVLAKMNGVVINKLLSWLTVSRLYSHILYKTNSPRR